MGGFFYPGIDKQRIKMYNNIKGGEQMKTKKEVCEFFKVSIGTVNNWIKQGKIKAVKIGRSVRIPEEEIERLKKGE